MEMEMEIKTNENQPLDRTKVRAKIDITAAESNLESV